MSRTELEALEREVVACRRCSRLVAWREEVAREKRKAFANEAYWGRPVPGFGDPDPWLLVVGLAPAAHGANRTGRMFTGDRSGDFLYAALHRAGLASQAEATAVDDGLVLTGCRITAPVRCAPPQNRPTAAERHNCFPYFLRELDACPNARILLALGGIAWETTLRVLGPPKPKPRFGHGATASLAERRLIGSYHPSQQNTFTGRLTPEMMDDVLETAAHLRDETLEG